MRPLIFLTGMPGAGKTYWGRKLAALYNLPYLDLDALIEQQAGRSTEDLFREGEQVFREQERAALMQVINNRTRPAIIATGGGTPMFFDNMEVMKSNGCVIYLKADTATLIARLKADTKVRPLLASGELEDKLLRLEAARGAKYEEAHYIFEVESLTEATFAEIFAVCIDRH